MRQSELELNGGRPVAWELPASRSKNNRPRRLPLPPLAIELITEAVSLSPEADALFPITAGHALSNAMARITAALPEDALGSHSWRADPPTAHDLRRTTASRMAAAGTSIEDVASVLGHVLPGITAKHYAHYARDPEKARALARWSAILSVILTPPEADVVVPLRPDGEVIEKTRQRQR
jgi:integrase